MSGLELAWAFGDPFFDGAGGLADVGGLYPLAIAGHPYKIETAQYDRRTLDAFRQAQDTTATPGESTLSTVGAWIKYQDDWHFGAGQERFDGDGPDPAVRRRRFRASKGVDIWTWDQLTLLPDTELVEATSGSTPLLLAIADRLYLADEDVLAYATDPTGTWTTVTGTPVGDNILGLTTDGLTIYAATADGVYSGSISGGSVSLFSVAEDPFHAILFGNGRLVAGTDGGNLVELSNVGAETVITTHFNTAFEWTVLAAGPNKLYAGGAHGGVTTLLRIGVAEDGSLINEGAALSLPAGESLRAMTVITKYAVLSTSRGVRFAQIGADGSLDYGPVIVQPGDVRCLTTEGANVWFGWTNYDGDSTGLGRMNLEQLAADLQPAWASDLMATAQGVVTSVARFAEATWFVVAGDGVFGPTGLVESGTLDVGWMDHGIPYDKVWATVDLRHAPLPEGADIIATMYGSQGAVAGSGSSSTVDSTRPINRINLNSHRTERARLVLTLRQSAGESPTLYRWLGRAFASPDRSDEISVPVILREGLNVGWGEEQYAPMDTVAELRFLQSLCSSGQIVFYQEGVITEEVKVAGLNQKGATWNDDFSAIEGILLVILQTV